MKGYTVIGQTLDGKPLYRSEDKECAGVFVDSRGIPVMAKLFGIMCNEAIAKKSAYRELTK